MGDKAFTWRMKLDFKLSLLLAATSILSINRVAAQGHLTDVVVFSSDASGNWTGPDVWHTRPNGNFEVFIQNGGSFLNGPTSTNVQPNIPLVTGNNSFNLFADPGSDYPHFGINLFFDGSSVPSISVFAPILTAAQGTNSFLANSAQRTPKPFPGVNTGYNFPGAGAFSFVSGNQLVTLTDFYWASPSVYKLNMVGGYSIGADGVNDYVGGITLSVTQVPEPSLGMWSMGFLASIFALCHRTRNRESN